MRTKHRYKILEFCVKYQELAEGLLSVQYSEHGHQVLKAITPPFLRQSQGQIGHPLSYSLI